MPDTPSDPHAPRAPYMEVLAVLTAEIKTGKYAPGELIPSDAALCARFGVARETARRAVKILRERGLIRTEWGRGSRVVDRSVDGAEGA
ncbi:winged helix-turn-helix domain-containing protein [Streptomyces eurocidicus]|nr:winged helix-turn-helix domain-containing protein [Streptomyces eurocidicus]MBB5122746.1 DNA-binding GntR family transcriptional regulator [Streptomyces eurocidicus]